jgi:hypothetical protein
MLSHMHIHFEHKPGEVWADPDLSTERYVGALTSLGPFTDEFGDKFEMLIVTALDGSEVLAYRRFESSGTVNQWAICLY